MHVHYINHHVMAAVMVHVVRIPFLSFCAKPISVMLRHPITVD